MTTLKRRFQIEVLPDVAWAEFLRVDAQRDVFERVAGEVMPSLRDG